MATALRTDSALLDSADLSSNAIRARDLDKTTKTTNALAQAALELSAPQSSQVLTS